MVEEAIQPQLNEKCFDVWSWYMFNKYEWVLAGRSYIGYQNRGAYRKYLDRERLDKGGQHQPVLSGVPL